MQNQSILIIEGDPKEQKAFSALLKSSCTVKIVPSAKEAYYELRHHHFDLLLLEIDLPDENGFDFCTRLKADDNINLPPFIFISKHDQTPYLVRAFSLDADDYIIKPLIKEQFEARIAAKLRNKINKNNNIATYGNIEVDRFQQRAFHLTKDNKADLELTSIEFRLLRYFLTHMNQELPRHQILNDIWGEDVNVTDRTVDTHVYTLRKKLGSLAECIATVPGIGYQYQNIDNKKIA